MDLTGNHHGGSFEVLASSQERIVILKKIAEVGLGGFDERDEDRKKAFGPQVVSAVLKGNDWPRDVLEVVAATLEIPWQTDDVQASAAAAVLSLQSRHALDRYPRK